MKDRGSLAQGGNRNGSSNTAPDLQMARHPCFSCSRDDRATILTPSPSVTPTAWELDQTSPGSFPKFIGVPGEADAVEANDAWHPRDSRLLVRLASLGLPMPAWVSAWAFRVDVGRFQRTSTGCGPKHQAAKKQ